MSVPKCSFIANLTDLPFQADHYPKFPTQSLLWPDHRPTPLWVEPDSPTDKNSGEQERAFGIWETDLGNKEGKAALSVHGPVKTCFSVVCRSDSNKHSNLASGTQQQALAQASRNRTVCGILVLGGGHIHSKIPTRNEGSKDKIKFPGKRLWNINYSVRKPKWGTWFS